MLVLSRKLHQQIVIESLNIRITVLRIGGNRVQLGIEAPLGVSITRAELFESNDDGLMLRTVLSQNKQPIHPVSPKHPNGITPRTVSSKNHGQERVCVD